MQIKSSSNKSKSKSKYSISTIFKLFQSNIIPVEPDMNDLDVCFDWQININNLLYNSEISYRVKTNNGTNWLYFASNLREQGRETLNITSTIDAFSYRKYEGKAKIQDGGRFTYLNPSWP